MSSDTGKKKPINNDGGMLETQIGTQPKDAGVPKRPLEVGSHVISNPDHPKYTADKVTTKIFPGGKSAMIAVMDGVGSGDETSANASEIVQRNLLRAESPVEAALTIAHARILLKNAIFQSNLEIKSLKKRLHNPDVDTTVTAGIVCESVDRSARFLVTANLGDSRIYRWRPRDGTLTQLTKDHSSVQQKIIAGQISEADLYRNPDLINERRFILNSVGSDRVKAPKDIDTLVFEVNEEDYFLAVSDGVIDNLPPEGLKVAVQNEMAASFDRSKNKPDLKKFSQGLTTRAENVMRQNIAKYAKNDDISVAILRT